MSAGRIRSFLLWFVYLFLLCLLNQAVAQSSATGAQQTSPPHVNCQHRANPPPECLSSPEYAQPSQAPAAPAPAQQNIYHCRLGSQKGNHVTYYSSGWIHTDPGELTALEAAWTKYIRATYDVTNPNEIGICDGVATHSDEQAWISNWERGTATQTRFASVVHVNWSYTPQHVATTASSQPAAATATAPQPAAAPTAAPAGSTTQQHRMPPPPPAPAAGTPTQLAPVHSHALDESPAPMKVKGFHCIFTTHQGTRAVRYSSSLVQSDATLARLTPAGKTMCALPTMSLRRCTDTADASQ